MLRVSGFLELHTLMQLTSRKFQHMIQFSEKQGDTFLLVLHLHALDSQSHDIDRREREITPSDRSLRSETILEYTGTAPHGRYLVDIALRIVRFPILALVEGRVEIQEVREETTGGDLAGQLVKIVVTVFRQIAYASFLFPYLDREDSGLAVTYASVSAF